MTLKKIMKKNGEKIHMKITFIGAGSVKFTRNLVRDLLTFSALKDCTITLMDTEEEALALAKAACERIIEAGRYPAKIVATTDRAEALKGANAVVCTIKVGGYKAERADIEIPRKYGITTCVGDTRGPYGIFRFLRTVPIMLDICKDIERYCPDALFLNYTNPMAMLCRAMQEQSKVMVTGLCHSVQLSAKMLGEWIGAKEDEITYLCAGINHQAWYLDFKWKGKDAYPLIREAIERPEVYLQETVRNEMYKHLNYYVTESSAHNSEYNPWFRKREDLIEKYCNPCTGEISAKTKIMGEIDRNIHRRREDYTKWMAKPVDLKLGYEFAANIINAVHGDHTMYEFNGNVRNFGLIDNLPEGCCVEVPVVASKRGLSAVHVGALPSHLAILNNINARCEELAVEAALTGDPEKVYYAVYHDPLTSAILSLPEIKAMVGEMFEASREWLPQFKHIK